MNLKQCKTCKEIKDTSEFYGVGKLKDNSLRFHHSCKLCVLEYNRTLYKSNPKYQEKRKIQNQNRSNESLIKDKERASSFYKSIHGRVLTLLKSANRRADNFQQPCDLDYDFIYTKLKKGICEVTGITFDLNKPKITVKNPYAPSIDRIDSSIGYTKHNTRLVIWQYNAMKGEISDNDLLNLCKIILERNKNGLDL